MPAETRETRPAAVVVVEEIYAALLAVPVLLLLRHTGRNFLGRDPVNWVYR